MQICDVPWWSSHSGTGKHARMCSSVDGLEQGVSEAVGWSGRHHRLPWYWRLRYGRGCTLLLIARSVPTNGGMQCDSVQALCVGYDGVESEHSDEATPQQRENKVRRCPRHFLSNGHQKHSSLSLRVKSIYLLSQSRECTCKSQHALLLKKYRISAISRSSMSPSPAARFIKRHAHVDM